MIICCPNCNFSRTVDETRIPATAKAATCPKCQHKFRFRDIPEASSAGEEGSPPDMGGQMDDAGLAATAGSQLRDDVKRPAGDDEDIWDRVASLGEHWADDEYAQDSTETASEAAAREQGRAAGQVVPWERLTVTGLFRSFFQTLWLALLQPRRLFNALAASRKTWPAVVFFLVVTIVQTYLFQAWLKLMPEIALAFGLGSEQPLFELAEPLPIMLAAPFVWLTFLLALSILTSLGLRILGSAQVTLPGMVRLISYTSAPLLFAVIPFAGTAVGLLWALWLLLFGSIRIYRVNPVLAFLVIVPVYLCLLVLKIIVAGSF